MKNVTFLYYFLFIIPLINFGQNLQNSNWVFGQRAGLNFSSPSVLPTSFTIPNTVTFNQSEGCASVSASNGNLLFFTDGTRVWQFWGGNYNVITANLNGNYSSSQNVIIVPRPNHQDRYFIITIDGWSGNKRGIFCSEIDLSNGIAQMISINVPLRDSNNQLIDQTYINFSESITSSIHSNGVDYWVICHVQNATNSELVSYLVTESGFNLNPTFNLPIPPDVVSLDEPAFSIKVSLKDFHPKFLSFTKFYGANLGTFDDSNGAITLNPINIGNTSKKRIYSSEFSLNKLYYTTVNALNQPTIAYISLNPLIINQEITLFTNTSNQSFGALQMNSIDIKKIYCAKNGTPFLSVIEDDGGLNPTFDDNIVILDRICELGLPQNVPSHPLTCSETLTLTSPNHDVYVNQNNNRQASGTITASNLIENNANAIYHAGESIVLSNGFHSDSGSRLRAYIEGCSNVFDGRDSNSDQFKDEANLSKSEPEMIVYPNPSNSTITIDADSVFIHKIIINSIDGKVMHLQNVNSNKLEIDISNFSNGIYILNIETKEGKIISKKLVKN